MRSLSRAAWLPVLLMASSACGTGEGERPDAEASAAGDPTLVLLDSVPALMQRADVPGLQLAFIEGGRVGMTAAFGYANAETEVPVTDRTVFEAASLSKPVFAYAVLRMVDRGEWDLDQPLWETLEYERLAHDERAREITTRQVLTHTSGLPNWGGSPLEMNDAPGERWNYSGEGFVYLQNAVEASTGLSGEEIATREVFEPLGMTDSHFVWVDAYEEQAAFRHDDLATPVGRSMPDETNAAASLLTTATDYSRFVVAVLDGEGLSEATRAALFEPGAALSTAAWGDDEEAMAHLFWGLGWGLQEGRRGDAFWHWGDNGPSRCFVIAYPEDGSGLLYFTNSQNGLAIAPALVGLVFDDDQYALRWMDYAPYDDPRRQARLRVTGAFFDGGVEAGAAAFDDEAAEDPDLLDEGQVNNLGYVLLRRDAVDQAVWVFERNTIDYPESSNVWDSYGEGLRAAGRLEESIANYRKSIELDPANENARGYIAEMEEELAAGVT